MPFAMPLTSPQITALRASGYWSRVLCCLNPNDVVFRCISTQTMDSSPFITFTWDSADIGSYLDVWEGMIIYLSKTTNIRDAYFRGRVRLAPSATEIYVDLNDSILTTGDSVIIVRDADLFPRIRRDTLVDGSITYHDLVPQLENLPSCFVLYDSDNDGSVTLTPAQTGIPVDKAATAISTWAWDVSGAGTSSFDDATLEHPLITFQAGYHYLLRVIYTDDNGQTNYQISHVYAITRTFASPANVYVVTGNVSATQDDGWTATLTAYANVSTLLDRTHCVVFHLEHFGDNTSTPIFSNVLMSGRIRSDSIETQGTEDAGPVKQVTFAVEGITAYLRRLTIPNDIIRAKTAPAAWGEIQEPNPYRMACYAMWTYTTLTNIGSFGVQSGAFSDWQIGAEPRGIDGGKALDVLNSILEPIRSAANFAPSGEIFMAQTASYVTDRSTLETIVVLGLSDIVTYSVQLDSSKTTSQVVVWAGSFDSAANDFVLYTASAPSIVGSEGDTRELTREILVANASVTDAQTDIGLRASNDYAFQNSKPLLSQTLFDSYCGVLIPTNYQRWAAVLPASSNTLGVAYTSSDYWQLQSVSLQIDASGTVDTSGEWYAETSFDSHQIDSELLPDNLTDMAPNLPTLPNEPALPTDPLENYPTDDPSLEEYQTGDPFSGLQAWTPFPPDQAAAAAQRQAKVGCKVLQPFFSNSSNTESSWTTALGTDYLITASGSAQIATGTWTQTFDANALSVWALYGVTDTGVQGVYSAGVGWTNSYFTRGATGHNGIQIHYGSFTSSVVTGVSFTYNAVAGTSNTTAFEFFFIVNQAGTVLASSNTPPTTGSHQTFAWSGSTTTTDIAIRAFASTNTPPVDGGGSMVIPSITITGLGTNPFTGAPGSGTVYADSFYRYQLDDSGAVLADTVIALPYDQGLFIDNSVYIPTGGIPPFNESHRYQNLAFAGTNNTLKARMVFSSYTDVQRVYQTLEVCRKTS